MVQIISIISDSIFTLWTALHLYILGAIYVIKELNRKYHIFSSVRHLSADDEDLPKTLDGKVAIITGGSRGIGLEVAKVLLIKGCHVIIASSAKNDFSEKLKRKIIQELSEKNKSIKLGKLEIWYLDLMSLESVQKFVQKFLSSGVKQLNYLINNAAIMFAPKKVTTDGFESHFQVNYLGHCLLIWSLMPVMIKSAQKCGKMSRIVNVSSSTHYARNLNLNDLQSRQIYSPFHAYAQSKLAQIMFTFSFHKWLNTTGEEYCENLTVNSVHPGVAKTELYENVWWVKIAPFVAKTLFRTAKEGAETIIYAALSSELEGVGGKYLEDCTIIKPSSYSLVDEYQQQLWTETWTVLSDHIQGMPNPLPIIV